MYIYMNLYLADAIIFLKYFLLIDIFNTKGCVNQQWEKHTKSQCKASLNHIFSCFLKSTEIKTYSSLIILAGEKQITNLPYEQNNESENKSLKYKVIR